MKKIIREEFRVEVYPDIRYMKLTEDRIKSMCDDIALQIRRHVDVGDVHVTCDTSIVCEYCGYGWELDEDGIPACCDKAIEEAEATLTPAT